MGRVGERRVVGRDGEGGWVVERVVERVVGRVGGRRVVGRMGEGEW